MLGTIITIVLRFLSPIWGWVCYRAVVSRVLDPTGFTRLPDYVYPKGDQRNKIKIGSHIDFELSWCREINKGDLAHNRLMFQLPLGSLRLQVVGWGCLGEAVSTRCCGSFSDVGQIGILRFSQGRNGRTLDIPIVLPGDWRSNILKLADGNPIFSGDPSLEEIRAAGFLGRCQFPYPKSGYMLWVAANIWASEVSIPWWARFAVFWATDGSMHLIHVQARKLIFPISWLRSIIIFPTRAEFISEGKDPIEEIRRRYKGIEACETLARQRPSNPEQAKRRSKDLVNAGVQRMTVAYAPQTFDRISEIKKAVEDFLLAADLLSSDHWQDISAYNAYAFHAALQLGVDRTLIDMYPKLLNHFYSCLERAKDCGDDVEALRCRWHIGWVSLEVARLASLFLQSGTDTFDIDQDMEVIRTQAGRTCFEMYHDQIAIPALQSHDPLRLDVAKERLDIICSHANELGLTEEMKRIVDGTRSQVREAM